MKNQSAWCSAQNWMKSGLNESGITIESVRFDITAIFKKELCNPVKYFDTLLFMTFYWFWLGPSNRCIISVKWTNSTFHLQTVQGRFAQLAPLRKLMLTFYTVTQILHSLWLLVTGNLQQSSYKLSDLLKVNVVIFIDWEERVCWLSPPSQRIYVMLVA